MTSATTATVDFGAIEVSFERSAHTRLDKRRQVNASFKLMVTKSGRAGDFDQCTVLLRSAANAKQPCTMWCAESATMGVCRESELLCWVQWFDPVTIS